MKYNIFSIFSWSELLFDNREFYGLSDLIIVKFVKLLRIYIFLTMRIAAIFAHCGEDILLCNARNAMKILRNYRLSQNNTILLR